MCTATRSVARAPLTTAYPVTEQVPSRAMAPSPGCPIARRPFLVGVAAIAAGAGGLLAPVPAAAAQGQPFSDGSYFADDGTGWVD